ncbi:MAG: prephenate dehydratase domain-containing protein [bacterium]
MSEKAGYLGPDNVTFGYIAAEKYFKGQTIEFVPYDSHYQICEAVGKGQVECGIVAIENVLDGPVTETIHAVEHIFRKYGIHIFAEIELPIELFYLRKVSEDSCPVKVLSHAVALRQCREFVASLQNQGIVVEIRNSTGEAAKEASVNPEYAVIASSKAESVYGLERLIDKSVTDNDCNFTRFWVLGKHLANKTGQDKTCILINLDQAVSGVLCKALQCFSNNNINLLIIFPNPIKGRKWEYTFLLEFAGHIFDKGMEKAYEELNKSGLCPGGPLVLGSYPSAEKEEE